MKKALIKDSDTCVSAYKKKQEFMGGYVEIDELHCLKYFKKISYDNFSKIYINKELIIN